MPETSSTVCQAADIVTRCQHLHEMLAFVGKSQHFMKVSTPCHRASRQATAECDIGALSGRLMYNCTT